MQCAFYFEAVVTVGNVRGLVIVISIIFMIFFSVMLFVCVFALWCILLNFMWFVEKNLMWCILLPKKLFDLVVVLFFFAILFQYISLLGIGLLVSLTCTLFKEIKCYF